MHNAQSHPLIRVLKSPYFYLGLLSLVAGALMNFASENYLHNYMNEGKQLPMLSDLILDNLPYMNVSFMYDIFCIIPVGLLIIYLIHRQEYERIPFILLMAGIFYIIRGMFIVLTPFGNPPMFNGTVSPFHGFSKYELGVYPSGHAGNIFMMYLLVNDKRYKWLIMICLVIVIATLFLARGHYSIDVLSGLFFSYAIKSFGEKHLSSFDLSSGLRAQGSEQNLP